MIQPSDRDFDRAVEQALAEVPDEFQPYLENLVVEVRRHPDAKLMRQYDVPDDLLGLYVGTPLEDKGSDMALSPMPDRILIFRDNLCEICADWDELVDEIRITVLHEIGHHFGLDEDRLEELGYD
ncbi:MAG: metallopeptidase family protein [Planctomycetota bacterium]